jgi:diguanylate cyclase (GGDEF)-like protein
MPSPPCRFAAADGRRGGRTESRRKPGRARSHDRVFVWSGQVFHLPVTFRGQSEIPFRDVIRAMQSLASRIGGAFLIVALAGCAVVGYGAVTVAGVAGDMQVLLDHDISVAIAVLRTQNHLIRLGSSVAGELATATPNVARVRGFVTDRLSDYDDRLAEMRAASPQGRAEADRLQPGFDQVRASAGRVIAALERGQTGEARGLLAGELAPLLERHATLTRERVEAWMSDLKTRRADVMHRAAEARWGLLEAVTIPMLSALYGAVWIYGPGLRRPLRRLALATENLRRGNYNEPITGFDRGDEIGGLAAILEQLRHEALRAGLLEREAREREAEAEASRLRELTNAAFEGIAICDGDVVTEANTSLADMLGMPRDAIIGCAIHDLFRQEDGGPLEEAVQAASGRPVAAHIQAQDGPVPAELCIRRLIGRDGGQHVIVTARDLREQRAVEQRVDFLASHDPLTGLANQTMLRKDLERALDTAQRAGESIALLAIDLDHFSLVNDLHGHLAGDTLLKTAATRLQACVAAVDRVARLGGDEFVIMQVGAAQPQGADLLARRVLESLDLPFELDAETKVALSATVGVAVFPADAATADALLTFSRTALTQAKAEGPGTYRLFQPEMEAELRQRAALELDLRAALADDQLWLAYQPQALTIDGAIVGFEVLLRWSHPERGLVQPGQFIPISESLGLIPDIGAWVLRAACAEAATWHHPLRIAVNVSPLQFERGDFARLVESVLAETGLAPSRLEVEITESMLIRDGPTVMRTMRSLRRLGVQIALDDFGTGYSSLSTLHNFAFDRVKVDRSFVVDMPGSAKAAAIVRAVIALAHSLHLPVIAEGVETEAQRLALAAEGCEEVQGYLIGKPRPVSAYASYIGGRIDRDSLAAGAVPLI